MDLTNMKNLIHCLKLRCSLKNGCGKLSTQMNTYLYGRGRYTGIRTRDSVPGRTDVIINVKDKSVEPEAVVRDFNKVIKEAAKPVQVIYCIKQLEEPLWSCDRLAPEQHHAALVKKSQQHNNMKTKYRQYFKLHQVNATFDLVAYPPGYNAIVKYAKKRNAKVVAYP